MAGSVKTYIPIVIGDYLKDTMHLACSEHGAYLMLLFHYWTSGPPPDDDKMLAAISRCERSAWPEIRKVIEPFFSIADGVWTHKRVEDELARAQAKQTKNSARAKAAADARWNAASNAPSMREAMLEQCPPSPSPIKKESEIHPAAASSTIPAPRQNRGTGAAAQTLPADWTPDRANLDLALSMGLTLPEAERAALKFRAYWTTGRGQGTRRKPAGWNTTWANWISKEANHVGQRPAQPAPTRQERNVGHADPDIRKADMLGILEGLGLDRVPGAGAPDTRETGP